MRRLRGVLISLFLGATTGGLQLAHVRGDAPELPLIAIVIVVAIAAAFFREPNEGTK
jgi:hypothetical protein